MAELGCFASTWDFSRTIAFACGAPSSGSDFFFRFSMRLMYHLFCQRAVFLRCFNLFPAFNPRAFFPIQLLPALEGILPFYPRNPLHELPLVNPTRPTCYMRSHLRLILR